MAQSTSISPEDCSVVAQEWLRRLNEAGESGDVESFSQLLLADGWIRDLLCFSWELRTLAGRDKIVSYLTERPVENNTTPHKTRFSHSSLSNLKLQADSGIGPPTMITIPRGKTELQGVMACFTFSLENPERTGRGLVRLVKETDSESENWKAATIFFTVEDLVGHEEDVKERPEGVWDNHAKPWQEVKAEKIQSVEDDPTVLIVGGGQSGLMCAARMGHMGIRALVVDKSARIGDSWRNRYPNLSLHTPAVHSTILYHPWPKTYPKWLPKDMIADWLEAYANGQNLVVWLSSTVLSDPRPVYDEEKRSWTVSVQRIIRSSDGDSVIKVITLHPKHLVMCVGNGRQNFPHFKGVSDFKGTTHHSDQHKDVKRWAGKKAVVVGACNAAGDAVQSFLSTNHSAASVTMIQRSPTCVINIKTADRTMFAFALETRSVEDNDFFMQSVPSRLALMQAATGDTQKMKKMDEKLLTKLGEKGFSLTWELEPGGGEVGIWGFVLEKVARGSMIDIGCCQSIVDGKVQVKSQVEIDHFEPDAIVLSDGSRVEADVVVLATGYEPMVNSFKDLFGDSITEKIGTKFLDLDEEGEPSKCYRPSGQKGLWITAGTFYHARFFCKHLALQILAEELGLKD